MVVRITVSNTNSNNNSKMLYRSVDFNDLVKIST